MVNLSLPKTGSTTIYRYFERSGACHEGLHEKTVDLIIDYCEGSIALDELRIMIIRRQHFLRASLDSSTFLHLIAPEIVSFYPDDTLYISILRNPVQWGKSYLGMLYQFGKHIKQGIAPFDPAWAKRYGTFQAKELDPIRLFENIADRDYLDLVAHNLIKFWIDSEKRIFNSIPPAQLRAFRLEDLGEAVKTISTAMGSELNSYHPLQKFNSATVDETAKSLIAKSFERFKQDPLLTESLRFYGELCSQKIR